MGASLSGVFNLQEFTDLGLLGAGMRLYTYVPATTNQKVAYTDQAGSIPQTYTNDGLGGQYIALNSRGELPAPLFLTSGGYDVALKTSAGVTVWTRRAIGGDDTAISLVSALAASIISSGITTISGDGATDKSASIAAANAVGKPVFFNVSAGVVVVSTPTTLTVPIIDTASQIFSAASQVTIDNSFPVRPEWFGLTMGCVMRAINSLPSAGGVVLCADRVYPPSYNTATASMFTARGGAPGVDYMIHKRVKIQGAKLPEYNSGGTALQNGSIIQGPFYVSCECDGFEIDEVGIDSGSAVCTALYGGAEQDGLAIVQVNKTTPIIGLDFNIGHVRGLGKIGATGIHAVLIESVNGGTIGYAEGRNAFHGVGLKSRNMQVGALVGHGNGGEDVIIKADTYAVCSELQIASVVAGGLTGVETGVGVQIQAGTAGLGSIQIGNVFTFRKDYALVVVAGGQIIADVNVANVMGQSCTFGGYQLSGDCRRVKAGAVTINATPTGIVITGATDRSNTIDELGVANCTTGVDCTGKINIAKAHFDTVTTALTYSAAGSEIYLGAYTSIGLTNFWNIAPTLAGTWAQNAGGDTFKAVLDGGKIVMSGLLTPGAAATITSVLDARIRPAQNYRFVCLGYNGAAYAPIEVLVSTAGAVSASNFAAASSYLSLAGVQWPIPF